MPVDIQKVGTSVIPGGLDAQEVVRRSEAACAALSDYEDGLKRDILGHAGNRWSLGVVHALGVKVISIILIVLHVCHYSSSIRNEDFYSREPYKDMT